MEPKRRGRPPGTHPPKRYTDRVDFYATAMMKDWILNCGGGAYLRQLVRRDVEAALSTYTEGAASEEEIAALERIITAEGK